MDERRNGFDPSGQDGSQPPAGVSPEDLASLERMQQERDKQAAASPELQALKAHQAQEVFEKAHPESKQRVDSEADAILREYGIAEVALREMNKYQDPPLVFGNCDFSITYRFDPTEGDKGEDIFWIKARDRNTSKEATAKFETHDFNEAVEAGTLSGNQTRVIQALGWNRDAAVNEGLSLRGLTVDRMKFDEEK